MPIYQYRCPCGAVRDAFNRVSERRTNAPVCHGPMEIELTPVMGYLQLDCNYTCPVTGEIVTSQRKRNYIMESHDLRDANDYRSNFQKQKQEFEQRKQLAATLSLPERDEKSIGKMLEELNPIPN